jgi:hypothetical protein
MMIFIFLAWNCSFAQPVDVNFHIFEEDKQDITPVMVCITNLDDSVVVVPPAGNAAAPATFPAPFFNGTNYSPDKNWTGPVRKTIGCMETIHRSLTGVNR